MLVAASPRVFRALLLTGLILRAAGLPSRGTVDLDVWKLWTYAGSISVTTMYGVGGNPPERAVLSWEHRRGTVEYPRPAALPLQAPPSSRRSCWLLLRESARCRT